MHCRFCNTPLEHVFADLGHAPPSNSYIRPEDLNEAETYYPLKTWTCSNCFLCQIDEFKSHDEIFSEDYAYFSSMSSSWLLHCEHFVNKIVDEFELTSDSKVVEVASNDGYLLQYVKAKHIPCLGVEPTAGTAQAARDKGIETVEVFFGKDSAAKLVKDGWQADFTIANNVLAHVPDINDFVGGYKTLLKENGIACFEFPHLLQLVTHNQFDTIYHEHFSYLSLLTVEKIAEAQGLRVFHVEEIPTHGGSLRVMMTHQDSSENPRRASVDDVLKKERDARMDHMSFYTDFQPKIEKIRLDFWDFLLTQKKEGRSIAAYGAAAKGNTLLNYCGVKQGIIDYVCDRSPLKKGTYLPGSHIPVLAPEEIEKTKPNFIVIFPWNIKDEVTDQLAIARTWGAQFVVAIPELEVF